MAKQGFGHRLYTGEAGFNFVAKRKIFYIVSILLVVGSCSLFIFKGLNFGIEFVGGNTFEVPAKSSQIDQARAVVGKGLEDATVAAKAKAKDPATVKDGEIASAQVVGSGGSTSILVKTTTLSPAAASEIAQSLATTFEPEITARLTAAGTPVTDAAVKAQVSDQAIDATWGGDISRKAVIALVVFLVAVSAFLRIRYRWGLVVGALVAVLHDLIVAAGIYALVGFEVTPATVIGLLTILGFSLYDTVVVFDKVDENTKPLLAGSRMTFSSATNLAINQTLMRSINTTVISLLPVAALLFVGAGVLGAGTLKDLALVLLIGMAAGAYSSIFLAAPIACEFAERRPEYIDLARRVKAREAKEARKVANASSDADDGDSSGAEAVRAREVVSAGVGAKPKPGARPLVGKTATKPVANTPARPARTTTVIEPRKKTTDPRDSDKSATPVEQSAPVKRKSAGTAPKPGAKPARKPGQK